MRQWIKIVEAVAVPGAGRRAPDRHRFKVYNFNYQRTDQNGAWSKPRTWVTVEPYSAWQGYVDAHEHEGPWEVAGVQMIDRAEPSPDGESHGIGINSVLAPSREAAIAAIREWKVADSSDEDLFSGWFEPVTETMRVAGRRPERRRIFYFVLQGLERRYELQDEFVYSDEKWASLGSLIYRPPYSEDVKIKSGGASNYSVRARNLPDAISLLRKVGVRDRDLPTLPSQPIGEDRIPGSGGRRRLPAKHTFVYFANLETGKVERTDWTDYSEAEWQKEAASGAVRKGYGTDSVIVQWSNTDSDPEQDALMLFVRTDRSGHADALAQQTLSRMPTHDERPWEYDERIKAVG